MAVHEWDEINATGRSSSASGEGQNICRRYKVFDAQITNGEDSQYEDMSGVEALVIDTEGIDSSNTVEVHGVIPDDGDRPSSTDDNRVIQTIVGDYIYEITNPPHFVKFRRASSDGSTPVDVRVQKNLKAGLRR